MNMLPKFLVPVCGANRAHQMRVVNATQQYFHGTKASLVLDLDKCFRDRKL